MKDPKYNQDEPIDESGVTEMPEPRDVFAEDKLDFAPWDGVNTPEDLDPQQPPEFESLPNLSSEDKPEPVDLPPLEKTETTEAPIEATRTPAPEFHPIGEDGNKPLPLTEQPGSPFELVTNEDTEKLELTSADTDSLDRPRFDYGSRPELPAPSASLREAFPAGIYKHPKTPEKSKGQFIIGLLLLLFCGATLILTQDDMGLTDDDDFYIPASIDYIKWVEKAVKKGVTGDFSQFKSAAIDRHWGNNHEHPAVAKLVMGAGWLIFHKYTGLMGQNDAARMGVIALALLLFYLVYRMSWQIFGPRAAVFSVLALLTMPRTFYHMHVPTLDIPTTATLFLVVYAAWRAETSRRWVILTGIFYGVAMCTKLNGPFVVFPLVLYWLYRWRQSVVLQAAATLRFGRMFKTGLSMALLSFPVFLALWPWLWHHPIDRLEGYFRFHFHHYGIRLLYFGDVYLDPFAPWHAPFVYTGLTIPLVLLVLGLAGLWVGLKQLTPSHIDHFPKGPGAREDYALLLAFNVLFAISIVAFPNNPKYGGVKLWQPLFPFFAMLAGFGFELLLQRIKELWPRLNLTKPLLAALLGLLLLSPGALGMMRVYPYMLSYFNSLAGGPQGAAEMGMERQYYDLCYRSMIEWWNKQGEDGQTVTYEPNNIEYQRTYPWYARDGKLKKRVRVTDMKNADFLILTHERRWSHYQELLNVYRFQPELHTEKVWGVPLYTIYDVRELNKRQKKAKPKPKSRKSGKRGAAKPTVQPLRVQKKADKLGKPVTNPRPKAKTEPSKKVRPKKPSKTPRSNKAKTTSKSRTQEKR